MNSPEEADLSDISSYLSTSSTHIFDSPTRNLNSDALNFGAASGNKNYFGNIDSDTPPLSPLRDRDTASTSMPVEYHPYLNGKMNSNLWHL